MSAEREELREEIDRIVVYALAQMARWAQHNDSEPRSEDVTDRILALLGAREEPVLYTRREFIEAIRESKKAGNRALFTNYLWLNPTEEDIQRRDMVPLYSEPVGRAQESEPTEAEGVVPMTRELVEAFRDHLREMASELDRSLPTESRAQESERVEQRAVNVLDVAGRMKAYGYDAETLRVLTDHILGGAEIPMPSEAREPVGYVTPRQIERLRAEGWTEGRIRITAESRIIASAPETSHTVALYTSPERASEPTEAETRQPYRSPQIINVADALRAAESREGEERDG